MIRAAVDGWKLPCQRTGPGHEIARLVGGVQVEVGIDELVDEPVDNQGAGVVIVLVKDPLDLTEHRTEDLWLAAAEQADEVARDLADPEELAVALVGLSRVG